MVKLHNFFNWMTHTVLCVTMARLWMLHADAAQYMCWSKQAAEQNVSTIYAISLQEFLNTPILAETQ